MKTRNLLLIALATVALGFAILWYQGYQKVKQSAFDAAAAVVEDIAKVLLPLIEAEKVRADSAVAERDRMREQVTVYVTVADSIRSARQPIIQRIISQPVPEEAREFTEPRDAVIDSQAEENAALRSALVAADSAQRATDAALSAERNARMMSERIANEALNALAMRPRSRWYVPTLGLGYSATVSRREFMKEGRIEIHDGPSLSAVWSIGF